MRQPDVATLQAAIAALPDDRLRPLLLKLLGATPAVPSQDERKPDAAENVPPKHAGGRPRGRKTRQPGPRRQPSWPPSQAERRLCRP
jgi:hypothetical protein